jgi:hypothetical protein
MVNRRAATFVTPGINGNALEGVGAGAGVAVGCASVFGRGSMARYRRSLVKSRDALAWW